MCHENKPVPSNTRTYRCRAPPALGCGPPLFFPSDFNLPRCPFRRDDLTAQHCSIQTPPALNNGVEGLCVPGRLGLRTRAAHRRRRHTGGRHHLSLIKPQMLLGPRLCNPVNVLYMTTPEKNIMRKNILFQNVDSCITLHPILPKKNSL